MHISLDLHLHLIWFQKYFFQIWCEKCLKLCFSFWPECSCRVFLSPGFMVSHAWLHVSVTTGPPSVSSLLSTPGRCPLKVYQWTTSLVSSVGLVTGKPQQEVGGSGKRERSSLHTLYLVSCDIDPVPHVPKVASSTWLCFLLCFGTHCSLVPWDLGGFTVVGSSCLVPWGLEWIPQ